MRRLAALAPLGAAAGGLGWALGHAGLPSSYLFAALLVGLAAALVRPGRATVPEVGFGAGQALAGVVLGAQLRSSSLSAITHSGLAVALVSAGTLGISIAAGALLARIAPVDRPTAALGMVAGGA